MNAAIYLRRSTDKQEYSLDDQEGAIREYAAKHGYVIVERFEDDAVSGTSVTGREGFKRMIQRGTQKNPGFEAVLVYDISRFCRTDPDEAAHYEFVLRDNGVKVLYIAEPLSGDGSVSDMLIKPVKRTLAHMYSLELAQKVKRGMRTNASQGFYNGGTAPYGYKRMLVDENGKQIGILEDGRHKAEKTQRVKLVPGDAREVAVVRRIFDCYVHKNMGGTAICDLLNGQRILSAGLLKRVDGKYTRVQRIWNKEVIIHILANPIYVGTIVWGRTRPGRQQDSEPIVMQHAHEPLVNEEIFQRAAEIRRKRAPRTGRSYGSKFLLTGLITCSRCGFKFGGRTASTSGKHTYRYYVDGGFHHRGKHICQKFSVPKDRLESFVLSEIRSRVDALRKEGHLARELRRLLKGRIEVTSKDKAKAIQATMKGIDARIARVMDLCEMGGVTAAEAHRRLEALRSEKRESEAVTHDLYTNLSAEQVEQAVHEMQGYLNDYDGIMNQATPDELKLYVRAFIDRIEVDSRIPQATFYFHRLPLSSLPPDFALRHMRPSNEYDVYAQRVDASGAVQWMPGGDAMCVRPGYQQYPAVCSDGFGGAIVAWADRRDGSYFEIYAQRARASGRIDAPSILAVEDLPGDQGGWARLTVGAAMRDKIGEVSWPITGYNVWRRIGAGGAGMPVGSLSSGSLPMPLSGALQSPAPVGLSLTSDGQYPPGTRLSVAASAAVGFPPGEWESLGFHAATQDSQYCFVVATKNDSTGSGGAQEVFVVSSHASTPWIYFASWPDSGHSVDNLAPGTPAGLAGDYAYPPSQLLLTWFPNAEADLSHYAVYKGDNESFVPSEGNRIGVPGDTFFVDTSFDPDIDCYYKVSALDTHENESGYSLLRSNDVTGVPGTPGVPFATSLEQNVPNPFNPVTVIRYSLATSGRVVLRVFDVSGRPVRTLFAGEREAGSYEASWDGRNDRGAQSASGVYVCLLESPGHNLAIKMALMR